MAWTDQLLLDLDGMAATQAVPMGPKTWYGVGGPAELLVRPRSIHELSTLLQRARELDKPVHVLGGGANLLVDDQGVPGLVIELTEPKFREMAVDGSVCRVGAGMDLMKLVLRLARQGLAGTETLAGIPGTVGGAIRMNAGGSLGEISQVLACALVMTREGTVVMRRRNELGFAYRHSNLDGDIVLEAELDLEHDDPHEMVRHVKQVFLFKRNTQPMGAASAGCAFKNPINPDHRRDDPSQPARLSAGKLIDQVGLKGHRIGSAQVSTQHANFIVVDPDGRAGDIQKLMAHIQHTVADRTGIQLEPEVVIWP